MLDVKLIRENPELVKNNLAKRGISECILMLEDLIAVDREWRLNLTRLNELRHQRKQVTVEIAKLKKSGQEASSEVRKAQDIDVKITLMEKQVAEHEQKTRDYLMRLPNLLDDSVPLGRDSNDNVQIKTWEQSQNSIFQ